MNGRAIHLQQVEERCSRDRAVYQQFEERRGISYLKLQDKGRAGLSGGTLGSKPVPLCRAFAHRRMIIVVALTFVPAVRNSERLMPDIDADEH